MGFQRGGHKYNARAAYVCGLVVYTKAEMDLLIQGAGWQRDVFKWFQSTAEARRYVYLLGLEQAGEIAFLGTQPSYDLIVNGVFIATYRADFRYVRGREMVVEDVKGMVTDAYKMKRALVLALHGIRIVEIGTRPPSLKKKGRARAKV